MERGGNDAPTRAEERRETALFEIGGRTPATQGTEALPQSGRRFGVPPGGHGVEVADPPGERPTVESGEQAAQAPVRLLETIPPAFFFCFSLHHEVYFPASSSARSSSDASIGARSPSSSPCARFNRDFTVPSEQPRTSASSGYDNPST